ncbi:hypothetical protein [Morganella morganii]|uniref:phage tail fiber protein n=1 Tax=Morganella morganii TaxID=582 RepID=UPI001EFC0FD2|nr:hypothetical protein [Morganella morganii]
MIYTDGTIAINAGSPIVTGTGTQWKKNIHGVAPGQLISIESGTAPVSMMIRAVNSDTELVLSFNAPVTLSGAKYSIATTVPDTISDAARTMSANQGYIVYFLQAMQQWMTDTGRVVIELPNGQKVTLDSIKAMNATLEGKVNYAAHADVGGVDSLGNGSMNAARSRLRVYRTNAGIVTVYSRPSDSEPYQTEQAFPVGKGVIWSTSNTKTDTNGFIKKASPVIEIHPDGHYETNDESEGAVVSRTDTGQYHITGVLGYNSDGAWGVNGGISVPKDNNGLELVYVDDRVLEDGSIIIETCHRQHAHLPERFQNWRLKEVTPEGERIFWQDGEPCDLPESTRLDVRVEMPQGSVWNVKQRELAEQMEREQAEREAQEAAEQGVDSDQ